MISKTAGAPKKDKIDSPSCKHTLSPHNTDTGSKEKYRHI